MASDTPVFVLRGSDLAMAASRLARRGRPGRVVARAMLVGCVMTAERDTLAALREELAALEHEQWAAWAMTLLATESISAERRARWQPLINADYASLSEEMKDHDREWADRSIAAMRAAGVRVAPSPDDVRLFHGHHPACPWTVDGDWSACVCGAAPSPETPGLREAAQAVVDAWDDDAMPDENGPDAMVEGVKALRAALAALPPRDALDVERVPLAYPKRFDGKAIDHEDGCAFAYGNTTYPCLCFALAATPEEP